MEIQVIFLATVICFAFFAYDATALNQSDEIQTKFSEKHDQNSFAAQVSWNVDDGTLGPLRSSRPTPFNCVGLIIHKYYIVTAASCFTKIIEGKKRDDQPLTVNLTLENIPTRIRAMFWDGRDPPNNQTRAGTLLHVHTNYLHQTTMFDVDIALMQTSEPWQLGTNPRFQPRIAQHIKEDDYMRCAAARIGFVDKNGIEGKDGGRVLIYAVRVGREKYCKYMQKLQTRWELLFDTFYLCATPEKKSVQPTCNGDVGGPLFCSGLLAGVLSQRREKRPCDEDGTSYLMYTAIGAPIVFDWIRSKVPDLANALPLPPTDPWITTTTRRQPSG